MPCYRKRRRGPGLLDEVRLEMLQEIAGILERFTAPRLSRCSVHFRSVPPPCPCINTHRPTPDLVERAAQAYQELPSYALPVLP
jgi:hypothetical protein